MEPSRVMPRQPNSAFPTAQDPVGRQQPAARAKPGAGITFGTVAPAFLSAANLIIRWFKKFPTIVLVLMAVIATGAGAATGNAMRGDIQAKIPITVYQALGVETPQPYAIPSGRPFFGGTSDDSTKFSIAVEAFRGESLTVLVPMVNNSSGDTVAEFSVILPNVPSQIETVPGLTLSVTGSGRVDDVVKISPDSWTFTADADLDGLSADPDDGLLLTFTVAPTAMSGHFEISGRIRTLEF